MRSTEYSLLLAQAERNHHGRLLSTTIDAFESSVEGKTVAIQAEARQIAT